MTEFTERSPIEAGFSKVYEARIAPRLKELEEKRQAVLAVAKRHAAIALSAGGTLGLLLFGSGSDGLAGTLAGFGIPLAFGAGAALLLWKRQGAKWSGSAAQAVMPVVCDFLGDLSYSPLTALTTLTSPPSHRLRHAGASWVFLWHELYQSRARQCPTRCRTDRRGLQQPRSWVGQSLILRRKGNWFASSGGRN